MTNATTPGRRTPKTCPPDCYVQSFSVPFTYPVHFTRDVFNPASPLLASVFGPREHGRPHRVLVFVDDGVVRASPRLPARMAAYFRRRAGFDLLAPPEVIGGGLPAQLCGGRGRRVPAGHGRFYRCAGAPRSAAGSPAHDGAGPERCRRGD